MHGYAENDLEFEDTSGQYTIANESLVSHNISSFVHGGFTSQDLLATHLYGALVTEEAELLPFS